MYPRRGDTSGTLLREGAECPAGLGQPNSKPAARACVSRYAGSPTPYKSARGSTCSTAATKKAGTWVVKAASGEGPYWTRAFARADDLEAASGGAIMDFWQAVEHVRAVDRGRWEGDAPLTVGAAVDQYEADLRARNADPGNAARIRAYLPDSIAAKFVIGLTVRDLQRIRDGMLTKGLARDSINRTGRAFKAALSLAASRDMRISNVLAWKIGLAALPNAGAARATSSLPTPRCVSLSGRPIPSTAHLASWSKSPQSPARASVSSPAWKCRTCKTIAQPPGS
jgi:hypothetical protein